MPSSLSYNGVCIDLSFTHEVTRKIRLAEDYRTVVDWLLRVSGIVMGSGLAIEELRQRLNQPGRPLLYAVGGALQLNVEDARPQSVEVCEIEGCGYCFVNFEVRAEERR